MGLISMNIEEKVMQIPIEDILPNRFQPRLNFDDQALQELAASIKQHGIIQPLVLRKLGDKYEIIAGERRYKASQLAGLTTVPAVISNIDDDKSAEVALIENIQRKNLTPIEEAKSYKNLLDRGYLTQEQLAEKMGISQSTIANKLRLLNLTDEVQDALLNEKISERHARSLLTIKDPEEQVKWLNKIITDRLTVRQLDIELKKVVSNENESDDDTSIPIVELNPNIEQIKENAFDINPVQGLHDIESMLKPSMPGEKTYDLNQVETLDLDDLDEDEVVTTEKIKTEEESQKPQNKFFNFLEDEIANMNEDSSIDDIFSNQSTMDIFTNQPTIDTSNTNPILENNIELTNEIKNDSIISEPTLEEVVTPGEELKNDLENQLNNINTTNLEVENDNLIDNNIIEENNIIEPVLEPKIDNVFDPMSMVNTLDPNYQEKVEEEQGIDLKSAINVIRETKESLEAKGFNLTIDEADLGDSYKIDITIIK